MKKIPLTQGKFALVDNEDFEELNQFKWCLVAGKYPVRHKKVSRGLYAIVRMHREIMNPPEDMHVDHVNGDTLDNRRSNLRICTPQQNQCNRGRQANNKSGYKGVYRHQKKGLRKPWYIAVKSKSRTVKRGMFATPEEAAREYNIEALKLQGEFARLNNV